MNEVNSRPFQNPTPERVQQFIDRVELYKKDDDPTFWSDDCLYEERNRLLRRQIGWLEEASPYYQSKFKEWGLHSQDIKTIDDLVKIPVTTKNDLMGNPGDFRLRFDKPTIYDHAYNTVYTTGTTFGQPTPYEYTSHDFLGILLAGRRNFKMQYALPNDTLLSVFPLSPLPHVAMFAGPIANSAGISYIMGMTGPQYLEFPVHRTSNGVLDQIEHLKPQIVTGITSYMRYLLQQAEEQGRDLSSIYMLQVSGETVTASMREKMHTSLAACGAENVFISSPYGFTEGGLAWSPCHEGGNLHCVSPDQVMVEILDPDTHERVPDGESGLVAITHLNRRGMPLLRYLLGDISAMTHERCPHCGRGGDSLMLSCGSAHVTRTHGLIKVKGVLVNPECIHDVVMNIPEVQEYQLAVENRIQGDPDSGDRLVLNLGLDRACQIADGHLNTFVKKVEQKVFSASEVTPEVLIVDDPRSIYNPEKNFKAKRLVDNRAPRI